MLPDFLQVGYVNETAQPVNKKLDEKLKEYNEKFNDYPGCADFQGEDENLIEILDICIKENITFEDLVIGDLGPDDDI